MRMLASRARGLGFALTLALSVATGIVAISGPGQGRAVAATEKETELNARQAYAAARYDEAIELYARLYAETLNPIYLRNIARCHQKRRDTEKAIDAFQDYLAKSKSLSGAERKEIQGYIKDMERLRDEQAKEKRAQQAAEKDKASAAGPAGPKAANPATTATAPTTGVPAAAAVPGGAGVAGASAPAANPAPTTRAPWAGSVAPPWPGSPGAGAPAAPAPASGGPVLVARPGEPPPREPAHPVYTRWWFWTGIGVVVAGGVAAALLIPGGTTRPAC